MSKTYNAKLVYFIHQDDARLTLFDAILIFSPFLSAENGKKWLGKLDFRINWLRKNQRNFDYFR